MNNHFQRPNLTPSATKAGTPANGWQVAAQGADPLAAIGYEAADPSLQEPLWFETTLKEPLLWR